MKTYIITGISGSGKSTAMDAFEDMGFYCVDNMPVALLPKFIELPIKNDPGIKGLTFVMDVREKNFVTDFDGVVKTLKEDGQDPIIIFLDCDKETLLKRYSQTRRHHPYSSDGTLLDSIIAEKEIMSKIREKAHLLIDTSTLNVHNLKAEIFSIINREAKESLSSMKINVVSFGFKYGSPKGVELMMDVRFLDNPYFIPELKPKTGISNEVANFVLEKDESKEFLSKYLDLLDFLVPLYKGEGKAYLSIGIGCTGGRHRSVAIAEKIFKHLRGKNLDCNITHRDIKKDKYE